MSSRVVKRMKGGELIKNRPSNAMLLSGIAIGISVATIILRILDVLG